MKQNPLFVPVILEALVINQNNDYIAELTPNFRNLEQIMPLASCTMDQYFQVKNQMHGVHLHWTMPDALLHGEQGEMLEFHCLPNRWIIQRICYGDDKIERMAWLIESDFVTNKAYSTIYDMPKTTIPALKLVDGLWTGAGMAGELYGYQGDLREYGTDRTVEGYYLDRLTAVGSGDVTFAAFYPKCQTVFGFYDPMDNIESGVFTYLVTGYYEDVTQDPLNEKVLDTLKEFSWIYDDNTKLPDSTLCHGLVKGVIWNSKDDDEKKAGHEITVEVAIGNTSVEALSALIRDNMPEAEGLERILNAMQYNILNVLDDKNNPDALIDFEELIHEKQFSSEVNGYKWIVQKDEKAPDNCNNIAEELFEKINELNDLQAEVDIKTAENASLIKEIYFTWWKYVSIEKDPFRDSEQEQPENHFFSLKEYRTKMNGETDTGKHLDRIKELIAQIVANNKTIEDDNSDIDDLQQYINHELSAVYLYITKIEEYRCHLSNPPVVLLSGEDIKRSFKQGNQTNDEGQLPCRMDTVGTLPVTVNTVTVQLQEEDILALCTTPMKALPLPVEKLLAESVLLDRNSSSILAVEAFRKSGITYTADDLKAVTDQIRDTQIKLSATAEAPYMISNKDWVQPWNPMLMEWSIIISPARTDTVKDDSFQQFTLDEIDFENKSSGSCEEDWELQGTTLILPHAVINMYDMLNKLIADYGKDRKGYEKLQAVIDSLKKSDILSQQLDGFNEALLMQDKLPFIPVCNIDDKNDQMVKDMNKYVDSYVSSPRIGDDGTKFVPVRAGMAKLNQLWIVDSFGQFKEVFLGDDYIHISESMKAEGEKAGALLRPRFMQPCGMKFKWLSYKDETKEAIDSQSTAIFGYVIPNFIDYNLQIYDADGCMLGLIQRSNKGSKWMNCPGTSFDYKGIKYMHLLKFVESLIKEDDSLKDFLACLDQSFNSILPSNEDPFMQLCFGKVIALARASIKIFEKGTTAHVQFWDTELQCNNYNTEEFKVKLGDIRKVEDGLIGFYIGMEPEDIYKKMHSCLDIPSGASGYVLPDNTIDISLKDEPEKLTLLFNPTGDITIRTGFLPAKKIHPSSLFYEKQLNKLQYLLRTMPVIVQPESFSIPVPGNMDKTWTFFYSDNMDTLLEIKEIKAPVQKLPANKQKIMEGYMKAENKIKWKDGER